MNLELKAIHFYRYSEFLNTQKLDLIDVDFIKNSIEDAVDDEAIFVVIEEDIAISENLSLIDLDVQLRKIGKLTSDNYIHQVWFSGKVEISNALYDNDKGNLSASLVFENDFKSKNVIFGGTSLFFLKKVEISQLFYTQIGSEGNVYWKNAEKLIQIEVDNNQTWKIKDKYYDLSDDEIENTILDEIFLNKDDFFYYDEEEQYYYPLEEDDALVKAILNDKECFVV